MGNGHRHFGKPEEFERTEEVEEPVSVAEALRIMRNDIESLARRIARSQESARRETQLALASQEALGRLTAREVNQCLNNVETGLAELGRDPYI